MIRAVVRYVDPELSRIFSKKFVAGATGVVYKENAKYLVLYSSWEEDGEVSWFSKFDFIVIPKEHVTEIYYW